MAKSIAASNQKAHNEREAKNLATGMLLANQYADMNERNLATSVAELVDAKRGANGGGVATFVDQTDDIEEGGHAIMPTIPLQGVYAAGIEEYLKRPTKIYTYNWDITGATLSFEPYDLLLSDLPVTRKISNFFKITFGGLDIKIVTNGTPYLYGSYFLGFWPYYIVDPFATTFARSDLKTISSKPCFTMIDPSADSVRYMAIPEVKQYDMLVSNSTEQLGSIVGCVGAGLQSATSAGTTQYCYITFFASARNPKVEFNTTQKPYHGTSDEYKGKVSAPLAKLSKYSSMLSQVPMIGSYATSVSEAAKLGARAASMFGFAKPLDIENKLEVHVESSSNIPNSDGLDTSTNLSLSKSALTTIDPTLLGLPPDDEMAISYIARRWSNCGWINWADTDAVGAQLIYVPVDPNFGMDGTYPQGQTNLSFISNFFKYWRGSIEVRLVFCVSKFHTGRVQVMFEPNTVGASFTSDVTNVTQNWIIDLADRTEIEFTLPYAAQKQMLLTYNDAESNLFQWGHASTGLITGSNGNLYVNVLSQLRAGSVATGIKILMFVRAGPDFELFQPTFTGSRTSTSMFTYQASGVPGTAPTNAGYQYMGTSDNSTTSDTDTPVVSVMLASERILSMREVGKRFGATELVSPVNNSNALGISYFCVRDYPHQPGYSVTGSGLGAAQLLYYNNPHSIFTALGPAYVGWRGSIRTKLIPIMNANSCNLTIRAPGECSDYMRGSTTLDTVSLGRYLSRSMTGSVYTKTNIPWYLGANGNNVGSGEPVEVSNPWVNSNNFELVGDYCNDYGKGSGLVNISFNNAVSIGVTTFLTMKAFGDDFSFVFYKGPPVLYQTTIA